VANNNSSEAFSLLGTLGFYASYIVKGSSFTANPIDPSRALGAQMIAPHGFSGTECLDSYFQRVDNAVATFAMGGGQPQAFQAVNAVGIASADVTAALRSLEPGRVKVPGKTLLVQGSADTTVLPATTQALRQFMLSKESDVTLTLVTSPAATHTGILGTTEANSAINLHLATLFSPQ
jgi:hypothetical protein